MAKRDVGIIAGAPVDLQKLQKSINILTKFGVDVETAICQGPNLALRVQNTLTNFLEYQPEVLLVGASGTPQLPGLVARQTLLPVIALPITGQTAHPIDTLYAMTQVPTTIPVAIVGVDQFENAALYVLQILALKRPKLNAKLKAYRQGQRIE